jgi:hypothetical protein
VAELAVILQAVNNILEKTPAVDTEGKKAPWDAQSH